MDSNSQTGRNLHGITEIWERLVADDHTRPSFLELSTTLDVIMQSGENIEMKHTSHTFAKSLEASAGIDKLVIEDDQRPKEEDEQSLPEGDGEVVAKALVLVHISIMRDGAEQVKGFEKTHCLHFWSSFGGPQSPVDHWTLVGLSPVGMEVRALGSLASHDNTVPNKSGILHVGLDNGLVFGISSLKNEHWISHFQISGSDFQLPDFWIRFSVVVSDYYRPIANVVDNHKEIFNEDILD
jgi:hypothetical protein